MVILNLKYIITINNINRRKERDRYKRLKNKLSNIFVTKEEDNIQNVYIQENGKKLIQLAKQPNYTGMGRQEASALIYRVSTIGSREAVENVKAMLTYW